MVWIGPARAIASEPIVPILAFPKTDQALLDQLEGFRLINKMISEYMEAPDANAIMGDAFKAAIKSEPHSCKYCDRPHDKPHRSWCRLFVAQSSDSGVTPKAAEFSVEHRLGLRAV